MITRLFGRQWWWTTLLVLLGMAALVWLGFWQLDRLEERRAFNTMVADRWRQDPFDVNREGVPADLADLEYRRVEASGRFDYANQVALKNQMRGNVPGVNLVTPLVLDDGRAILVARGWVPIDQSAPEQWGQFDEQVDGSVVGLIQESETLPNGNPVTTPEEPQSAWFYLNIDAIQPQMPYELLPVFILQLPEDGRAYDALPFRDEPLRLTEGNHLSYAIQWFMFALILGFGYIQYVRFQDRRAERIREAAESPTESERRDPDVNLPEMPNQVS